MCEYSSDIMTVNQQFITSYVESSITDTPFHTVVTKIKSSVMKFTTSIMYLITSDGFPALSVEMSQIVNPTAG